MEEVFFIFILIRKLADICPLLEVDDMVRFQKPDWKCVFTYVQSFYRRFRNVPLQQKPEPETQTFNKSINEATSSMAQLSSTNKHDTTVGDKDSNEKRIEVSKESRSYESITREKTIHEPSSVISSLAACSGSSLSCTSFNRKGANNNFFGNQCNSIGFISF